MTEQTLQELFPILAAIKNPGDVQVMDEKELTRLGEEIRRMIIHRDMPSAIAASMCVRGTARMPARTVSDKNPLYETPSARTEAT